MDILPFCLVSDNNLPNHYKNIEVIKDLKCCNTCLPGELMMRYNYLKFFFETQKYTQYRSFGMDFGNLVFPVL